MKTTRIRSTTINLLPVLYYHASPDTIGIGWLGRGIEWAKEDPAPVTITFLRCPRCRFFIRRSTFEDHERYHDSLVSK
jgi:hypothetical protein